MRKKKMMRLRALTALSFAMVAAACARASATADDEGIVPQSGAVTVTGQVVNSDGAPRDSAALARVGFLQREDRIRGAYFLTPSDVASTRANRVSDLFRQIPVLIETTGPTGTVLRGAQGCLATYVDGIRWRSMFPGDLDIYVPVNDVVAAEVYPPGQLPPPPFNQLVNRVNCTTLAIWTRSAVG